MQRRRVVVIGAGIAGLAAAIRAAEGGAEVTVLERASHPGGRARTQARDGFSINLGPHALYAQGELMALLRRSKIPVEGRQPPARGWLGG